MTPDSLPSFGWLLLKLLTLVGIGVYTVFAGIIVRQEHTMTNVLEEGFEPVLRIVTYIHLVASVVVFFLALVIL